MKLGHTYVTEKYLKIRKDEYKDFLITMPIYSGEVKPHNQLNGEYEFAEVFNSFSYNEIEYDLYLHTGKSMVDPSPEGYLNIPLPTGFDNIMKNILFNTVFFKSDDPAYELNTFGFVRPNQLKELIKGIQTNAKVLDLNFSAHTIHKSLIRILETEYYIKRKGLKRWMPVPMVLCISFEFLTTELYNELGEDCQEEPFFY